MKLIKIFVEINFIILLFKDIYELYNIINIKIKSYKRYIVSRR